MISLFTSECCQGSSLALAVRQGCSADAEKVVYFSVLLGRLSTENFPGNEPCCSGGGGGVRVGLVELRFPTSISACRYHMPMALRVCEGTSTSDRFWW
ncbi:uncharacterized protein G2W53_020721 [Senna tora]|uniref:Uncharacterized protein n=1 Tax=Senna tora TaxID=362788 RepID=A0A834WH74_9FABA|nr:uncharacterized protein G2W53_020721 [Senna tora]